MCQSGSTGAGARFQLVGSHSKTCVVASLPFAPELVLRTAGVMLDRYPEILSDLQYASSFNPTLARADRRAWASAGLFGLDQGIVLMMIENHRTQLIWRLMRNCRPVRTGLRRAGFRGGWLQQRPSSKDHDNAPAQ